MPITTSKRGHQSSWQLAGEQVEWYNVVFKWTDKWHYRFWKKQREFEDEITHILGVGGWHCRVDWLPREVGFGGRQATDCRHWF
jgi:hypothetical protein